MAVTRIRDEQSLQTVDLTTEVTGTLPVANGGTGATTLNAAGIVTLTGAESLTNKIIGDDLDLTSQGATAPATPASGTIRLWARTAPSGLNALAYMNSLGVPFVIARDRLFYAQNNTGATLTKGTVVYVSSASTNVARISKAQADSGMTKVPAAGVVAADITNGSVGAVMQGGVLEGLDTSAFTDGATLYVSPTTAGVLTATKPAHPQVIQPVGECIAAHASAGLILLNIAELNASQFEGVNGTSWAVGDATGTTKNLLMKNASGTGTLEWNPTANRTVTLPDSTTTLVGNDTTQTLTNKIVQEKVTTSSATSLTLDTSSNVWVFTGSSATTWTMPAVSGNTGIRLTLRNRGTAQITVQRAGTDNLWQVSAVTSFVIPRDGGTAMVVNDGTYWVVTSPNRQLAVDTTFVDLTDQTKRVRFGAANVSTATVRTLSMPDADITAVGETLAQTLTNKWVQPRVVSPAVAGTYTVDWTNCDQYVIGTQNAAITNLTGTGTAVDGQKLMFRIKGDATPRAITWDSAKYVSSGVATLLATTAASKTHFVGCIYDGVLGKMVCIAVDATGY